MYILRSIFIVSLLSLQVMARDYYICSSCSNANDGNQGTLQQPYRSIQKGMDQVQAGETVFVMNGVYEIASNDWEPVVRITKAGTATSWITLRNYPGHAPVLRAAANIGKWSLIKIHPTSNSTPSYLIIDGLTIQGNRTSYTIEDAKRLSSLCGSNPDVSARANGQGINIVGPGYCYDSDISGVPKERIPHHIIIRNCKVFDCTSSGIAAFRSDEITIENNQVYNNCWYTTYGTSGINVYQSRNWNQNLPNDPLTTTTHRIVIRNNQIYGNGTLVKPSTTSCLRYDGNGIIIDDNTNSQPGDGCNTATNVPYTGRTLIANNVVFGNGGSGVHLFSSQYIDVYNNTLYKNSVVNNYQEIYYRKCAYGRVKNNIFYSSDFPGKKVNAILAGDIEYDYNIHFSITPNNYLLAYKGNGTSETHNIVVDPQYVSPPAISSDTNTIWTNMPISSNALGSFKIKPTSSAINYGLTIPSITTDMEGNVRTEPDLGAYEYQSTPIAADNIVPDLPFRNHLIAMGMDANADGSIQATEVGNVDTLIVRDKYNIKNLTGIEAFTDLVYLDCANNQLTQLNSASLLSLKYLDCAHNELTQLDVRHLPLLERLYCYNNQLQSIRLTETRNNTLRTIIISNNKLTSLYLSSLVRLDKLYCYANPTLESICVADVQKAQTNSNYRKDDLARWVTVCEVPSIPGNIIPDPKFKAALVALGLDANADGAIQAEEVSQVDTLLVNGKEIANLGGIQAFTSLVYLDCSSNRLTQIDSIKGNRELAYLDCSKNQLAHLDLFANTKLVKVYAYNNSLTSFKISKEKNITLRALVITNNRLAGTLNLRTSTYLDKLWCYNNTGLTEVCVANLTKANSSSEYRKDATAAWTSSCGYATRKGIENQEEEETASVISIYPNPGKGKVQIKASESIENISLESMSGEQIQTRVEKGEVDISSLPTGIYLVKITTASKIERRRLMVE